MEMRGEGSDVLDPAAGGARQVAEYEMSLGAARIGARVSVTPAGVLAIGAMVSGILLSSAAIVWAARRGRSGRPR
jgi:hypothetical protein